MAKIISENYGRTDLLKQEIYSLKAKLKTRDKTIERLKQNKSLEEFKHEIRKICKKSSFSALEKVNIIYDVTLK